MTRSKSDAPPERHPLSWPSKWPRTPTDERRRAVFGTKQRGEFKQQLTTTAAIERLAYEFDRLLGLSGTPIVSTNIPIRLDGGLMAARTEPADPGVAVYFRLHDQPMVLACDRWTRVADNLGAIAAHLEAMRGMERWGVGTADQLFLGYATLPPAPDASEWWRVFGVEPYASDAEVDEAYKRLAVQYHPDTGGNPDMMRVINEARAAYKADRK